MIWIFECEWQWCLKIGIENLRQSDECWKRWHRWWMTIHIGFRQVSFTETARLPSCHFSFGWVKVQYSASRSNNTMTTMIQVTANSTMHQPHPDVSDDNDVHRSCIMHLVYTVLRPKMGVSLSEFDERRFVMLKRKLRKMKMRTNVHWPCMHIAYICRQTLPPSYVCSYLIGAISKTFVEKIFM